MFCKNCGQRNDDNTQYCSACGQPLGYAPYAPQSGSNNLGIASMVCGIVSICMICELWLGLFCGIAAIILGVISRKKEPVRGYSTAGIICGSVSVVLCILIVILAIFSIVSFATLIPSILAHYN